MASSKSALVALLLTTSPGAAQPLVTSLQPSKDKLPAQLLEDRSAKANPDYYTCLYLDNEFGRGACYLCWCWLKVKALLNPASSCKAFKYYGDPIALHG